MYNIQTLNKISPLGLERFGSGKYAYGNGVNAPDAIMVRSAPMHETALDPNTAAIARCGAGTNNIPVDACAEQGVVVFNTPGANANGVAELVICALLLSSRKIAEGIAWCNTLKGQGDVGKAVEKGKGAFTGPEIKGKTLGIVGLGAIGRLVAEKALAMGMDVVGFDPFPVKGLPQAVKVVGSAMEVFESADYMTLHAPATADTKGMVNRDSIAVMKDGARIINLARGDLAVSSDILGALKSGKLSAYVTDFPTDEQLGADGVIAMPHLGASTPESEDNCAVMAADQLMLYLETGAIKNAVNFPDAELPADFTSRTCVLHRESAAETVKAALGEVTFSGARGGFGYTVADKEADVGALMAIDGVVRVRTLRN
ncbi:MAG: 3-phosphoglycerate dehydrogenase [Oscillospiraceae bacterium]|nr:3-phosphoglycerate dehydrogenase [Oscillospiraceae bacterium]